MHVFVTGEKSKGKGERRKVLLFNGYVHDAVINFPSIVLAK